MILNNHFHSPQFKTPQPKLPLYRQFQTSQVRYVVKIIKRASQTNFLSQIYNSFLIQAVKQKISTLQMFCLSKTQMFVCVKNPKAINGYFSIHLSVIGLQIFFCCFILLQQLNLLENNDFLLIQQIFVCQFDYFFHNCKILSVF